ncbi:MAG TPA: hypothetical protein VGI43_01260 [Mucilaginibacter sp.]|jgi:hypothetical protein
MKKQFFNYTLACMFLLGFADKVRAQSIQAEAKLQQYTIRIGDQTKLFLSVHQPAKEHVNFPKLGDTVVSKVQVVNTGKPDTTADKNDPKNITVIQGYTITSFDAGTYTIPPFAIGTAAGVLKTNELTLQVATVKVDTTKAIYDIKQPLAVSYTFWDWVKDNWYWIVIGVVALTAIGGLIWYYRNKPKKEVKIEAPKPKVAPHIIALKQLKELQEKKLWQQGEIKQFHIELTDILREYLEKRYLVKAHEQTTDEILSGLRRKHLNDDDKNVLNKILVLADLVKFAKEKPLPAENEQSINNAIYFIERTWQPELIESTEGGNTHV